MPERTDVRVLVTGTGCFVGHHLVSYLLVVIPPGIWTGFKGMSDVSIVANYATHPHDPTNTERIDPFGDQIPYDWAVRHQLSTRPECRCACGNARPRVREGAATAAPPERAKQCPSESVFAAVIEPVHEHSSVPFSESTGRLTPIGPRQRSR